MTAAVSLSHTVWCIYIACICVPFHRSIYVISDNMQLRFTQYTHTHTHTHLYTHMYTHVHTHTCSHTHAHTHMLTHTHHTHTHTHTHSHTSLTYPWSSSNPR